MNPLDRKINSINNDIKLYSKNRIYFCPIPKNASRLMDKSVDTSKDWKNIHYLRKDSIIDQQKNSKFVAWIRNPLERWVSGVAQYFQQKPPAERKLFEIVFDRHTLPQYKYLEGINRNLHLYNLDNSFIWKTMQTEYGFLENYKGPWRVHTMLRKEKMNQWTYQRIEDYLYSNDALRAKVEAVYEKDFELYHVSASNVTSL